MKNDYKFYELEGWQERIDDRFLKGCEYFKRRYNEIKQKVDNGSDIEEELNLKLPLNQEAKAFLGAAFYCRVDMNKLESFRDYLDTRIGKLVEDWK